MGDRQIMGAAKAFTYTVFIIAAAITLVRGIVSPLWGSATDLGLVGAVAAGGFGLIGLVWISLRLARDVSKHFNKE